ncbi:MAG: PaaI family thioesterase [Myxococcota bacterium]
MANEEPDFPKDKVLAKINEAFTEAAVPHNAALGLRAVDCGPGWATLELPYDDKLVGNPETGVLHGGAVTSLIDATSGMSVFMALMKPTRIATLDLRIDYLRPATPGQGVLARAECYKVTRQVAFVRGVAHHAEDPDDPIASAAGTFMIFREGTSAVGQRIQERGG